MVPSDENNVLALIKAADLALYKSKEHGKNRFTVY